MMGYMKQGAFLLAIWYALTLGGIAYAQEARNKVTNFLGGVISAPFKVLYQAGDQMVKGTKEAGILGTVNGLARGVGYGVVDSVENVGRGLVGQEISALDEMGYLSSKLDETATGRILTTAVVCGVTGGIVGHNGYLGTQAHHAVEGAAIGAATGATTQTLEEKVRR